jgi:hypothetical protein
LLLLLLLFMLLFLVVCFCCSVPVLSHLYTECPPMLTHLLYYDSVLHLTTIGSYQSCSAFVQIFFNANCIKLMEMLIL